MRAASSWYYKPTGESKQKTSKFIQREPIARQPVVIRKERETYRMSAIQNLQTFGKKEEIYVKLVVGRVGEGREDCLVRPNVFSTN